MTKQSYKDNICHEVKYNPANKKSESYKLYIKPFSHGTAEQWLKIHGQAQDCHSRQWTQQ